MPADELPERPTVARDNRLSLSQRLAIAERLVGENWADEDVERLAGVTLIQVVELRAERAAGVHVRRSQGPQG